MVRASWVGNGFENFSVGRLDRLLTTENLRTLAHMAIWTWGLPSPQQLRTRLHRLGANCREYFE
jgi:hypothetical protein